MIKSKKKLNIKNVANYKKLRLQAINNNNKRHTHKVQDYKARRRDIIAAVIVC